MFDLPFLQKSFEVSFYYNWLNGRFHQLQNSIIYRIRKVKSL
jgi:hypothetical protein